MDKELLAQYVSSYEYLTNIANPSKEIRAEIADIVDFLSLYFTSLDISKMLKRAH